MGGHGLWDACFPNTLHGEACRRPWGGGRSEKRRLIHSQVAAGPWCTNPGGGGWGGRSQSRPTLTLKGVHYGLQALHDIVRKPPRAQQCRGLSIPPSYRGRQSGSGRGHDLPKVTRLVSCGYYCGYNHNLEPWLSARIVLRPLHQLLHLLHLLATSLQVRSLGILHESSTQDLTTGM